MFFEHEIVTASNISGYGFPLTRIFPYKEDRPADSVLIYGNIRLRENPYSGIFYAMNEVMITLILRD